MKCCSLCRRSEGEGGRVRFQRKRTSCADDHLVIEMLKELDEDMWETFAKCFQFRLLNHWTEDQDMLWARQLVTMVKKKNGKLTMRGFRPIAMLPTMYRLCSRVLQQLAGQAIHTRYSPQYGHVPGRQAHEVVFIPRRMVEQANEWRMPIFVMDCDVAAALRPRLSPLDHRCHGGPESPSGVGVCVDQRIQGV